MSLPDETKDQLKLQLINSLIKEPINDVYGLMLNRDAYQILSDNRTEIDPLAFLTDSNYDWAVKAPTDFLDTSSYNWGVIETINNSITDFVIIIVILFNVNSNDSR